MARQDIGPVRRFFVVWLPVLCVVVFVVAVFSTNSSK